MASLRTPIGVLSFPVLFSPRPRAPGGDPVYQCSLLFDQQAQKDPLYLALRKAAAECIDTTWGPGKSQDKAFVAGLRSPFRPTQEKQYKGYDIPGGIFISPWTKTKPGLVDANRNEIMVPEDIWAGQLARATVAPFSYNQAGNRGVSFALNNLQICRTDGERLDGRIAAKNDFDDYTGPGAAQLVDDEVPF
jgi:Protein of unknown function (DUF2815)